MVGKARGRIEHRLRKAMEKALLLIKPNSIGVLCRKPLLDEDCPEASDLDLVSIWGKPEECPERMVVKTPLGKVFVDVLWIPMAAMLNPMEAASYRMLPHHLLESEEVWMRSRPALILIDKIRLNARKKVPWERRLSSQICFGDAALNEALRNLDFPPAAIFYLQTAHAYYVMALADSLKKGVMGVLTRPVTKLRNIATLTGPGLEKLLTVNLHLEVEPSPSLAALRRIYDAVKIRCMAQRPRGMNPTTRGHYAYSITPLELEYRETVAKALIKRGDHVNANFYIRFWAYSLSRCPIVLEEAKNGKDPSFYVPYEPLKTSLLRTCSEIIDDLALIFGSDITKGEAEESIRGTLVFRDLTMKIIKESNLHPTASREGLGSAAQWLTANRV